MKKILVGVLLLVFSLDSSAVSLSFADQQSSAAGQVFKVGNGVLPPKRAYTTNPQYTDAARKAKVSGNVLLSLIVNESGTVRDVQVERSLRPDLDQQAIAAVSTWRFEPATKDGLPVPVKMKVEVSFRLY